MRSPGQTFDFEGEMLTIAQIRQRVQIVSDASLRAHLAAGRNTAARSSRTCRSARSPPRRIAVAPCSDAGNPPNDRFRRR